MIDERVMAPAGQPRWLAIPLDQQDGIVDGFDVGAPIDPAEFERMFGMTLPDTGVTNEGLRELNDPGGPGARPSGRGRHHHRLRVSLVGTRRSSTTTARSCVPRSERTPFAPFRQTHEDPLRRVGAQRTHAFMLAGDDGQAPGRGHGHASSAWAFGHGGAKGQIAWADPETGVSLGFMTNGLDLNDIVVGRRSIAISSKAGLLTTPE